MYIWLMESYQVDILNPKAVKLLKNLAELKLISLSDPTTNSFLVAINKLRKTAASNAPTLEDITKEVEKVRANRHAQNKA